MLQVETTGTVVDKELPYLTVLMDSLSADNVFRNCRVPIFTNDLSDLVTCLIVNVD